MRFLAALLVSLFSSGALAGDCVVLLHGLGRTDASFTVMEETLTAFDFNVVSETYT